MTTLEVDLGEVWGTWNPPQLKFFNWEPKGRLSVEAFLGSWGVGKTKGVARKFVKRCFQNGYKPAYGSAQPRAAVCAPTHKVLQEATIPKLREALPRELILYERKSPPAYIDLINGLRILLVSAEATMEGVDLAVFWIDEISHDVFASNPQLYLNYLARLRDQHATQMSMLVSGLPLAGWVRENFDFKPGDPNNVVIFGGVKDNVDVTDKTRRFLPQETVEQLMAACPAGWENVLLSGTWGVPLGATFPMWDSKLHIVDDPGDPNAPVSIGIDVGERGAIVVGQKRRFQGKNIVGQPITIDGIHIVDQLLTEYAGVEEALYKFKTETQWRVVPGQSTIAIDPTTRRDELSQIYKHYPKVFVQQRRKGDDFFGVDDGLRHLQLCLKDALGNTRISVSSNLMRKKYGLIEAIEMAKGDPRRGILYVKDNSRDHILCATRYLATSLVSPPRAAPRVV